MNSRYRTVQMEEGKKMKYKKKHDSHSMKFVKLTILLSSLYQKVLGSSLANFSANHFPFCSPSGSRTHTLSSASGFSSYKPWEKEHKTVMIQPTLYCVNEPNVSVMRANQDCKTPGDINANARFSHDNWICESQYKNKTALRGVT